MNGNAKKDYVPKILSYAKPELRVSFHIAHFTLLFHCRRFAID